METSYNLAIENIKYAVDQLFLIEDSINDPQREDINHILNCVDEGYILVKWPDSQEYMGEDWFNEEAIFCGGSEEKTGSAAYFIPIKRIIL